MQQYESEFSLQFNVRVKDGRNPEKSDIAAVTVSVDRDEQVPTFQGPTTVTIEETEPVGNVIETVNATDNDLRVSTYRNKLFGEVILNLSAMALRQLLRLITGMYFSVL